VGLIVPEEHWEMFTRTLPQQNHSAAIGAEKAAAENAGFNQANSRVVFGWPAPRLRLTFPIVVADFCIEAKLSGRREEKVRTITGHSHWALIPPQSATDNWSG
jgi:hypothetical protein